MDGTEPYRFICFGAMDTGKPYKEALCPLLKKQSRLTEHIVVKHSLRHDPRVRHVLRNFLVPATTRPVVVQKNDDHIVITDVHLLGHPCLFDAAHHT